MGTTRRAMLFIDGSNWYHALRENRVRDTSDLNYARISEELVGPRKWVQTRYYGASLDQKSAPRLYADNRRFLSKIEQDDSRVKVLLGRVESRPIKNPLAGELRQFLQQNGDGLEPRHEGYLSTIARRYERVENHVEKGVDVRLAVDMYRLARDDEYDDAYLLSADGDFVPAVEAVTEMDKTIYAACPNYSSALANVCQTFIRMDRKWFYNCYR